MMSPKRYLWLGVGGVLLAAVPSGQADYTAHISRGVSAEGSVPLVAFLAAEPRNISGDQPADQVSFGGVGQPYQLAQQYVRITFRDNALAWGLSIHSNNAGADFLLRQESRAGGLLHTRLSSFVMAVGWQAYNTVQRPAPPPGDPRSPSGWRYMKDITDADWLTVGGYRNVAFGGPDYANIVPPLGPPVPNRTGIFYVYPEAIWNGVPGAYRGELILDLYSE